MSTVAQIMTKGPKTIGPKVSIASAAKAMRQRRVGSLFIKKESSSWGSSRIPILYDGLLHLGNH